MLYELSDPALRRVMQEAHAERSHALASHLRRLFSRRSRPAASIAAE